MNTKIREALQRANTRMQEDVLKKNITTQVCFWIGLVSLDKRTTRRLGQGFTGSSCLKITKLYTPLRIF